MNDNKKDTLLIWTEKFLSKRKKHKLYKKEEQSRKNFIEDWGGAFLWAACVVLLINQYLFQAYQIPSGSMEPTLIGTKIENGTKISGDRIFVNKLVYGPELLPGFGKIPGVKKPHRGDIIIFENPEYLSKGPAFDLIQRLIFMLTLSLVDIDKDESGEPSVHMLIKRGAAAHNDFIRLDRGNLCVKAEGMSDEITEKEFLEYQGNPFTTQRLLNDQYYIRMEDSYFAYYCRNQLRYSEEDLKKTLGDEYTSIQVGDFSSGVFDDYNLGTIASIFAYSQDPSSITGNNVYRRYAYGWYLPEGWIMPMGDNRDNSRDGRYFGPIPSKKVLGKAVFIYWPGTRMGVPGNR